MLGTRSSDLHHSTFNRQKLKILFLTIAAIVLTAIFYGRTIWLPFFFDDLVQLPFVDRYSFIEHWLGSNESPYYRPLVISIWKLSGNIFGFHSPIVQHGLNLVFHALNGLLIAILGMKLYGLVSEAAEQRSSGDSPLRYSATSSQTISNDSSMLKNPFFFGLLTLSLYLIFPFHHQAVPWPGAFFHIFVTTLILGSLIAYLNDRLVLALVIGFLAPFAHENGVVIPALIFCVELIRFIEAKRSWQNLIVKSVLMGTPALVWLILRSLVSVERASQTLFPGIESIWQSLTWFFQGLTWPSAIFWRFLPLQPWLNDLSQVWLLGGIAVAVSISFCWRPKSKLVLLLFGGCWWFIASAPAMLALPFGYIVNSPRLLSLAGCGIALFWTVVLMGLIDQLINQPIQFKWVGGIFLLIFCAAQYLAIGQIREANLYHLMLGDVYQQAAEIAYELDDLDQYPVFVNFPSSAAPSQKTFVLGNEGVVFWPGYAPQHTIVTTNRPIESIDQQFVQVDRIRSDQPYLYGIVRPTSTLEMVRHDTAAIFYNTIYMSDSMNLVEVGKVTNRPFGDQLGHFSPESGIFELALADWQVSREIIGIDPFYKIKIDWRLTINNEPAENITVFVHAVSESGELLDQRDGDPVDGLIPLDSIRIGNGLTEFRYVPSNPNISALRLGLYNRMTGERVPFFDDTGQRLPDDMFVYKHVKK